MLTLEQHFKSRTQSTLPPPRDTQRHDPTSFPIQWAVNFTVGYTEQFWIQISSSHDLPSPSQWADSGSSLTVNVTSPADDNGIGTRYRCTGYTLDSDAPITDGSIGYTLKTYRDTHNITFNWIVQYRLTVSSNHDSPVPFGPDNWYDTGALIAASVTSPEDQLEEQDTDAPAGLGQEARPRLEREHRRHSL